MGFTPLLDAAMMGHAAGSVPTSDLRPHVDGGNNSARGGSNAAMDPDDKMVMHISAGIVLLALILLWIMGAVVFKSARM